MKNLPAMFSLAFALCYFIYTVTGAPQCGCPNNDCVNCFVRPCQFSACAVEGATCSDDYCGGCNARWYLGGEEVTDQCNQFKCEECPPEKPCAQCFVAPCQTAACSVTGAFCVDDYCGGCNARWFLNGEEVTDQCAQYYRK